MHGEPYCFLLAETTLMLLAITVAAEARPFPDLTVEKLELTSESLLSCRQKKRSAPTKSGAEHYQTTSMNW